jgi:hypothetical protein
MRRSFRACSKIRGENVDGFQICARSRRGAECDRGVSACFCETRLGKLPHVYFGWSEGNPVSYLLKYIAFGEGDTAPVTHEVLRQAEKDPDQRPIVHVGG